MSCSRWIPQRDFRGPVQNQNGEAKGEEGKERERKRQRERGRLRWTALKHSPEFVL